MEFTDPLLSKITGVPVRIVDPWPYGKFRGYFEDGVISLRPGVYSKIKKTNRRG